MKIAYQFIAIAALSLGILGCGQTEETPEEHGHSHADETDTTVQEEGEAIHLSEEQIKTLGLRLSALQEKNLAGFVQASGTLEVPPQNEAIVTAVVGANVSNIKVIEGDKVQKGQVLAYLSHPDLITIQTDYISAKSELDYLEKNVKRQETLYDEKVGSGRTKEEATSKYIAQKGKVKGLEYKLKLIGISPESIADGNIVELAPVRSPINGYVQNVLIKTSQFVQPQTEMFEIINLHHIHADLMVFEKDVNKVMDGQKIKFTTESVPNKELIAEIYSVGKSFEENPKAVHIHAEIENKEGLLLPGMYIQGKIIVEESSSWVLPEDAVVQQGDKYYIFKFINKHDGLWHFEPMVVKVGLRENDYAEVFLPEGVSEASSFAANNAYYLMAELKKDEAGHGHSH